MHYYNIWRANYICASTVHATGETISMRSRTKLNEHCMNLFDQNMNLFDQRRNLSLQIDTSKFYGRIQT